MSDAKSSYELTKHLIENGHRKIGGMFKSDDMQGMERYRGYTECLTTGYAGTPQRTWRINSARKV